MLMTASLRGLSRAVVLFAVLVAVLPCSALAQQPEPATETAETEHRPGGEVSLVLPSLDLVDVGGYSGRALLMIGLGVSALGILFGLVILVLLVRPDGLFTRTRGLVERV